MIKAKVTAMQYVPSDSVRMQGSRKALEKYLEKGYRKTLDRNGFYILTLPSHFRVTLDNGITSKTFDMRETIKALYGKSRLTENTCTIFHKDISEGRILFFLAEDGATYEVEKNRLT